jgi:hypothetical protein
MAHRAGTLTFTDTKTMDNITKDNDDDYDYTIQLSTKLYGDTSA